MVVDALGRSSGALWWPAQQPIYHDTRRLRNSSVVAPPTLTLRESTTKDSFSPDLATHTENVHCTDSAHLAKVLCLLTWAAYAGYGRSALREKVIDHAARREGKRASNKEFTFPC